jgi:glycosyltransferase involved in cell wall biosynthesis
MSDTLLVISADLSDGPPSGPGPRKDYWVLASTLQATVLDRSWIERSRAGRLVALLVGPAVVLAWLAFRRHRHYGAVLTDGEHLGIPLALLFKLAGATIPHLTIGHRLSAAKKRPFFRWLKLHRQISRIALHSHRQYELAVQELGIPAKQLALVPYQVDTTFWQPQAVPEERLVCSAGLEFRDYPTLFRAVEGLDTQVVIGAASHWSKRPNRALGHARPENVQIGSFDYLALRELYARAAVVVVPLQEIDFQAGVTTVLEAMAMGKAVIVTHTEGQTDVVEDRRAVTRGSPPRPRPVSLLSLLAEQAGTVAEPTGFYVPPGESDALQRAIVYLLDHPEERQRLGAAGRRAVEQFMTVEQFAARLWGLVQEARGRVSRPSPEPARAAVASMACAPADAPGKLPEGC